jgi:hypothetical protein
MRQAIQNVDGKLQRPRIRYASICDPYALVIREDDSLGLFIGREGGTIRRKDMSPMGEKVPFLFLSNTLCLTSEHSHGGADIAIRGGMFLR